MVVGRGILQILGFARDDKGRVELTSAMDAGLQRTAAPVASMMFACHRVPRFLSARRKIKLFLMDVDGTITDGSVNLISLPGGGGVAEMKAFNSQDGAGLKLAHIMGIRTGLYYG